MRPGSRRASIMSRRSGSYGGPRPSFSFGQRNSSTQDVILSPSSGVFNDFESDDEGAGPSSRPLGGRMSASYHSVVSPPQPVSRRRSRRPSRAGSHAPGGGYFSYNPDGTQVTSPQDREDESPTLSPRRPSNTFGRIASYIGLGRGEHDDEAEVRGRYRSPGEHSRQGSLMTSNSGLRSPSRSSSEGWGYRDDDTGDMDEGESYTSSLADDTSLPPQSRPGSPHMPLIPNNSDAVFGESGRTFEDGEAKEFLSVEVPSRQTILLPDEDLSIRFTGYRTDQLRRVVWRVGCVLTLGGLGLLGRWIPSVWVKFCGKEVAFEDAKEGSWLMVEVSDPCWTMSR